VRKFNNLKKKDPRPKIPINKYAQPIYTVSVNSSDQTVNKEIIQILIWQIRILDTFVGTSAIVQSAG